MATPQKPDSNSLIYWWNELLFARYFEYETDLDPEQIAEQLERLQYKSIGWVWGTRQIAKTDLHANGKGLDFDIQRKVQRKLDFVGILSSRAQGTGHVDSATGRTIVSGTVKFGRTMHLLLLAYVIYIGVLTSFVIGLEGGFIMLPISLLVTLMLGVYWRILYNQRTELSEQVKQAITEKPKRDTSRLEDKFTQSNTAFIDPRREKRSLSNK